jgi:hypothetical protein
MNMTKYDDVNTPVIAAIGLLSVLSLVAFVLLLEVGYYQMSDQLSQQANVDQTELEVSNLMVAQEQQMAGYAWINEKKGIVAIPINRAMDLVLADLAGGKRPAEKPAPPAKGKENGHAKP